ncbi:prophage repressor CI [Serratia marcescens]|uniref:helix-turn-helix domain-containing protein n=1 Tax=Serratia TaxID=613 RepID=UPI000BC0AE32|nr:S24 family peptidase [Serratia sp. JKS000199]BEO71854.1 prophage repressor CI [Serratia marcescens]BEO86388.1 prophage repressor CI [Serratia marcescens]SNY85100.1 phage repressor protein. Serine peptidase. MEROPS family S24 [Serratia sp. JKS000199]
MNTNEKIAARLKSLRASRGLSQKELAIRCGWKSQSRIGNYELAERGVSIDDAITISKALGVSPSELLFGETATYAGHVVDVKESNPYPVLNLDTVSKHIVDMKITSTNDLNSWIESDAELVGDGFWISVPDESMSSSSGLSIPQTAFVLFDTNRDLKNGDLVAIKFNSSERATFKKYVEEPGLKFLKSLNPLWPIIPITEDFKILGIAVEAKIKLT